MIFRHFTQSWYFCARSTLFTNLIPQYVLHEVTEGVFFSETCPLETAQYHLMDSR